jgi:hypothetical protein
MLCVVVCIFNPLIDYHDVEVEFHIEGHPIVKRSVPLYDCRVHDRYVNIMIDCCLIPS